MKTIIETDRLILREFVLEDDAFIMEIVNTPEWLKFIGDKNVHSLKDAQMYLELGPLKSYQDNGFGLWLIQLKTGKQPIGICGLVNREWLENIDIGFALLPSFTGKGYGFEAASVTMKYAREVLKINKIVGITDPSNTSSIKLLERIGLSLEKTIQSEKDEVLLYS